MYLQLTPLVACFSIGLWAPKIYNYKIKNKNASFYLKVTHAHPIDFEPHFTLYPILIGAGGAIWAKAHWHNIKEFTYSND